MIKNFIMILRYRDGFIKRFSDEGFQGFQSGKFKTYMKISALKGCRISQYESSQKYLLKRDLCLITQ